MTWYSQLRDHVYDYVWSWTLFSVTHPLWENSSINGGFFLKRTNNAKLCGHISCWPVWAVEQTVEWPLIWYVLRPCDVIVMNTIDSNSPCTVLLVDLSVSVRYSSLSIYGGHFSLNNSRKTTHSSLVRARYGVSFVRAMFKLSFATVIVRLCAQSCCIWPRYTESLRAWKKKGWVILKQTKYIRHSVWTTGDIFSAKWSLC